MTSVLPKSWRRVLRLVEQSMPKRMRPQLSPEFEQQLMVTDARLAASYASMEDFTDRWRRLENTVDDENGAVSATIEENDSLVIHIDDVRSTARR